MTFEIPNNATRLLFVEGKVDKEFFIKLREHLNLPLVAYIIEYEGKENLGYAMLNTLNNPIFPAITHIGIVRDADFNTNALASIQSALNYANQNSSNPERQYPIPEITKHFYGDKPKLSALVLPDDDIEGMIEDVILQSLEDDPISICVDEYFSCLQGEPIPEALPKSKVRVFIEGKRVKSEETSRSDRERDYPSDIFHMSWWTWEHSAFDTVKQFLTDLCTDPAS